jgi:2-isopropylmalate synthase
MGRVRIFDTTLRDGDQAAGFCFGAGEKLALAAALAEAGVDVIETGFPLSGKIEFDICRAAALELKKSGPSGEARPLTAVMCRGRREEIAASAKVFSGGIPGILHISLPVSKIHIEAKLGRSERELIALAVEAVSFASGLAAEVELGAEDAFRADRSFLLEYCRAALDAGARTLNIADTLGVSSPGEIRDLVAFLLEGAPEFGGGGKEGRGVLSIHCHNDLGLACANTLAALEAGCAQAEVSVSGIGERAGNAALEEVAANIETRSGRLGLYTNLKPEKFPKLLNMAAEAAGSSFSLMKPLSGWNVRSHSSGIHQQGLSKNRETYTLPGPERWITAPERIVLSRHSGRAGAALFAERYCGLELDGETAATITEAIKNSETVTGLTEFLCLLSDMGKLPAHSPAPLVRLSFTETTAWPGKGAAPQVSVGAVLNAYNGTETERAISGTGESEAGAVSDALRKVCGFDLAFPRIALNGCGGKLRLYAEICSPAGRLYALERTGSSSAELLFLCGLDAVNAEALKQGEF